MDTKGDWFIKLVKVKLGDQIVLKQLFDDFVKYVSDLKVKIENDSDIKDCKELAFDFQSDKFSVHLLNKGIHVYYGYNEDLGQYSIKISESDQDMELINGVDKAIPNIDIEEITFEDGKVSFREDLCRYKFDKKNPNEKLIKSYFEYVFR